MGTLIEKSPRFFWLFPPGLRVIFSLSFVPCSLILPTITGRYRLATEDWGYA